jgi:hypothetical protein
LQKYICKNGMLLREKVFAPVENKRKSRLKGVIAVDLV